MRYFQKSKKTLSCILFFIAAVCFFFGIFLQWKDLRVWANTIGSEEFVDSDRIVIEGGVNHADWGDKKCLVFYAGDAGVANWSAISMNLQREQGDFLDKITLDGEDTALFTITPGHHMQDGQPMIELNYDSNPEFWTITTESYHALKIPAGTSLYNVRFSKDIFLYYYDGKWQTEEPILPGEEEYILINGYAINFQFNHVDVPNLPDTKNLILHFYRNSQMEDKVDVVFDQRYPKGDIESKIGFYDPEGQPIESGLYVNWTYGHMNDGSSALHLSYHDGAKWEKTNKSYIELRVQKGTHLFNLEMNKDFSMYYYNGKWQTNEPILDYEIDEENLDHFTLGELTELKPAKKETFILGPDTDSDVVAGTLTSALLESKSYEIEFDMTIQSEYYDIYLAMNGTTTNLWEGIGLRFMKRENGVQGVSYLDYINPEERLPDYLLDDFYFESNQKYNVKILVAKDTKDRGVLLRLTVDDDVKGELFVSVNQGYSISELMGNGFLICVNGGDGLYYGKATFTNIDTNAPVIQLNGEALLEAGEVAETFQYPIFVQDAMDGELSYTATIKSGTLSADGRFVAGNDYLVEIKAIDKAGNQAIETFTFRCADDVTPPNIVFGENVVDGSITVAIGITKDDLIRLLGVVATDNKDSQVMLDYHFPNGMFDGEEKIQEGRFRVEVIATDASGNETKMQVRVIANQEGVSGSGGGCKGCSGNLIASGGSLLLCIFLFGCAFIVKKLQVKK